MSQITYVNQFPVDQQIISLEQIIKRRLMRRRRVAKRMAKRFPMFAVEIMQAEFPGYTAEEFEADIFRKTRKGKSFRRPKTPMAKMGRYPEMLSMLNRYNQTKDPKFLAAAQQLRNRMWLPFVITLSFGSKAVYYQIPGHAQINFVKQLTEKLSKTNTIEEATQIFKLENDNYFKYVL